MFRSSSGRIGATIAMLLASSAAPSAAQATEGGSDDAFASFRTLCVEYVRKDNGRGAGTVFDVGATITLRLQREPWRWSRHTRLNSGGEHLELCDGTWLYRVDPIAKRGTRQWATRYLGSKLDERFDAELIELVGLKADGSAEVAGRTCAVWRTTDPFLGESTYMVWGEFVLATEERDDGALEQQTRAERIEIDPTLPESTWSLPDGVDLTEQRFPGQVYLEILANPAAPRATLATRTATSDATQATEDAFPGVGPFTAQPEWPLVHGSGALDVDRSVTLMGGLFGAAEETDAALAEMGLKAGDAPTVGDEDREEHSIGRSDERIWWMTVPRVVQVLGELRGSDAWDEAQLRSAHEAARFLALHPEGILVDLTSTEGRRARLDAVGRWFLEQAARPDRFASMLGTLDDGPFVGEEVDTGDVLEPTAGVALGDRLHLDLCALRGEAPTILRCRDGERVLWTRRVTAGSVGAVRGVELSKRAPDDYGSLGWLVILIADWSYGQEAMQLFLAPDGAFRFYLLSW